MVAVLAPTPRPALRPVVEPARRLPTAAPVTARPHLHVIEGGRSGVRSATAGVYVRRRIVAAVLLVLVLGLLVVGVRAAASLLTAPVTPTTPPVAAASPIAADTYVVRPGDTLWTIAARIDPAGDPRPVVDALRDRAGGAALEVGQRIDVSGLGA